VSASAIVRPLVWRLAAGGQELRQILRSQHDVASQCLAVSVSRMETHQLVSESSHSRPIRDDKLPSFKPRASHSGVMAAWVRHRWLHQTQNINSSNKISIIRELEFGERKASRRREQRLCGIACHDEDELRPEPSVVGDLWEFRSPEPSAAMQKSIDDVDLQLNSFKGNAQMNGGDRVSAFMNGSPLDRVFYHIVRPQRRADVAN
jgi:hypothetical protein